MIRYIAFNELSQVAPLKVATQKGHCDATPTHPLPSITSGGDEGVTHKIPIIAHEMIEILQHGGQRIHKNTISAMNCTIKK